MAGNTMAGEVYQIPPEAQKPKFRVTTLRKPTYTVQP
jgi:hypothetical protein